MGGKSRRPAIGALLLLAIGLAGRAAEPPSPREHLGFDPADGSRPLRWPEVEGYLRAVASACDRVKIGSLALTTDGRPLAFVRILDPRTPPAAGPRVRVLITCSLHADETGPAFAALHLIHRLAARRSPAADSVLRELEVLVFPAANPDGLDLLAPAGAGGGGNDGVEAGAGGDTAQRPALPALLSRYVGHDNNRDWILFTQAETRAYAKLFAGRPPALAVDLHGMGSGGPRLFLPPYGPPLNPAIPADNLARAERLGGAVRRRLESAGLRGIASGLYDAWTPARTYPFYHGSTRFLIEVAAPDRSSPVARGAPDSAAPDRPDGRWGMPQVVRYALAAVEETLAEVAAEPERWRSERERWRDAVAPAPGEARSAPGVAAPAWSLRAGDADPGTDPAAAREVLEALRRGGAEVRATAEGWEVRAPQGDRAPRGDGGIAGWLRTLLECTPYPADAGVPYDGTCHHLAHLAGLRFERTLSLSAEPALDGPVPVRPGRLLLETGAEPEASPSGPWLIDGGSLDVFRAAADLLDEGLEVRRTVAAAEAAGHRFGPGSFLVPAAPRARAEAIARETGATVAAAISLPPSVPLSLEGIGLAAATPSIDEGWTRWTLEDHHVPFRSVRSGAGLEGIRLLLVPEGGVRDDDLPALAGFVDRGGCVVALPGSARQISSALDLGVRERRAEEVPRGVLLRAAGRGHRLLLGAGEEVPVYVDGGPIWDAAGSPGGEAVLVFPAHPLLCGRLFGEDVLAGGSPLLDARRGKGRVVLFGFRPQFRGWTLGSVRVLLNAVFLPSSN